MEPCERKGVGTRVCALLMVSLLLAPVEALHAQTALSNRTAQPPFVEKTFYLKNAVQQNDANEILVAIRNIVDPVDKIYLVSSEQAIVMSAPPAQLDLAERLIGELDRPRRSYRLTVTMTEFDGARRVSERHVEVVTRAGQTASVKQGDKVPVMTGSYDSGSAMEKMQVTYIDVGMNLLLTLLDPPSGPVLKAKVERSSVASQTSGVGAQDPIIQQAVLEQETALTVGKPAVLGSLDLPESGHRLEIGVTAEPVS